MIFQEFRLWCFVRNRTEGAASVSEHDSQRPKRLEICGPHRAIDNSDMKLNELFEQVKIINLPERGDRRREMNLQLRRIGLRAPGRLRRDGQSIERSYKAGW